jgi:hypothetical protein
LIGKPVDEAAVDCRVERAICVRLQAHVPRLDHYGIPPRWWPLAGTMTFVHRRAPVEME